MNGRELYEIWAPSSSIWSIWARPLLFIFISKTKEMPITSILYLPKIVYLTELKKDCAVILDLPEKESVEEGLALAKMGWRPVPLYNGCDAQLGVMSLVDNQSIKDALILSSYELQKFSIADTAPPVFLLDSNRVYKHKMNKKIFDNGWDIYSQDMPSANYLLNNGISEIIIRSNKKLNHDLKNILYILQKGGLEIFYTDGYGNPIKMIIKKPKVL